MLTFIHHSGNETEVKVEGDPGVDIGVDAEPVFDPGAWDVAKSLGIVIDEANELSVVFDPYMFVTGNLVLFWSYYNLYILFI